jgi:hypothetical protein
MKNKLFVVLTVLLVHTAAAQAQQSPATADPADKAAQAFPPGYAPPPGYTPPAEAPPPSAPPPAGAPAPQQPGYAPPPNYGPQQGYGPGPTYYGPSPYGRQNRYPPPSYSYYPPPPPPRQITDRPFTLGGGIGFGGLVFNDPQNDRRTVDSGMAYTFRLGFGLRPGLILMWNLEGALVNKDTTATAQTANFAALQIFATQRLFLKAGFGLAQVVQNDRPSAWGGAAMAGIGYEIIQGWNWSLDIEATITGARYNTNGRDEIRMNWSLVNFAINFF